ncbi:2'-5' RNA ligase [Palleronia salina]|uniref:RNA 2',3'-cyclic phosphodiesterase n=1 Tax=Palleronia salina TaxID=313368 RepID=A0A1M6FQI3_9RHOB|nr:RNA 2',3'-cyclic phosphodiesterase [Palleronia salina]SHI99933.1 2'-5' RNA ligase [Palleronia salina]
MRIFVALDLPDDLTAALSRVQDRLIVGRPVDEDDFHLTLAFVPKVSIPQLDDLALDLEMLVPPPVALRVTGLDTFGAAHPRSLHAVVAPDPALLALQAKVATLVRRAGIDLPHRKFVPHVTLARFPSTIAPEDHARLGRFLSAHGGFTHPPVPAAGLTLYQSTLRDDGPVYDALQSHALG